MVNFKSFKKTMEVVGDFPVSISMTAENPDPEFVLMQQESELQSQLKIVQEQLARIRAASNSN